MSDKVILVAEDEEFNFLLLKHILEKEGFEVLRAKNGVEAVDMLKSGTAIDLVVMDVKMPKLSGLEATAEIRRLNFRVPIIALTAYALPGDREMCMEAGSDGYLSKPINRESFLEKINKLLALHRDGCQD